MPVVTNNQSRGNRTARFDALEGWRGVACLLVFVYHCGVNARVAPAAFYGFVGVHLFFVLSGFLLFRPYVTAMAAGGSLPAAGNFYLRRLLRIVPPYLASLVVFVAMRTVSGTNVPAPRAVLERASLLFNNDPGANFFAINSVYWSLAIELQFYLLLPLLALAGHRWVGARRGPVAVALAALAVGVLTRWAEVRFLPWPLPGNPDNVRFRSLFAYLDLFAFGMLAAAVQPGLAGLRPVPRLALLVAGGLVIWAANQWCAVTTGGTWQHDGPVAYLTTFPVVLCGGIAAVLLWVVTHPAGGPAWLRRGPLRWAGKVSFSLYLYHAGIQFFVFKLGWFDRFGYTLMTLGNAAVALPPALAVAAVAYWAVERPSLAMAARVRDLGRPAVNPSLSGTAAAADVGSLPLVGP
jgi:peptidoglycan/LPS O-acetylase OafA/YrhL